MKLKLYGLGGISVLSNMPGPLSRNDHSVSSIRPAFLWIEVQMMKA
jgi:hypothetical protein